MRSGILLLTGLLLVAGLPIFATVRILDKYALENAHDRADAALTPPDPRSADESLSPARRRCRRSCGRPSHSAVLQRAFLTGDRNRVERRRERSRASSSSSGAEGRGTRPPDRLISRFRRAHSRRRSRSVWSSRPSSWDEGLAGTTACRGRLTPRATAADRARKERDRNGPEGGARRKDRSSRRQALSRIRCPVPNAPGIKLVALRSEGEIAASVRPYQRNAPCTRPSARSHCSCSSASSSAARSCAR